ncbi:MAG TPA: dienelactone hydrolase family protein [Caulobacteraceae bacterium]|nr:dienelactone hydrolase family protein [Caulobacteraceae bacterium]
MVRIALALIAFLFALPAAAADVGFARIAVPDPLGETLAGAVWYPTEAAAAPHALNGLWQDVAEGAPVAGWRLPLVIISHGSGGWYGGHLDTALALARAGFVVAAVTHKGDDYADQSHTVEIDRRPVQAEALIQFMLNAWPEHARIDPGRVGAFGFSAGGFTVLVLAGGVPDLSKVNAHAAAHPTWFDSGIVRAAPPAALARTLAVKDWPHDAHIKAIVVAAPALGYTFGKAGLADIRAPVQLWKAQDDQILAAPDYADAVRADLPRPPEFHVVEDAGHYDFLTPCDADLAKRVPEICVSRPGFDRAAFHRSFDAAVVRFFAATLK